MYNCSQGNAPQYLIDLLTPKVSKRSLRSSVSCEGCYEVPFNKKKTFSDRSFCTVGPKLWNNLPASLRNCENVVNFKKHLKSLYFEDYFSLF